MKGALSGFEEMLSLYILMWTKPFCIGLLVWWSSFNHIFNLVFVIVGRTPHPSHVFLSIIHTSFRF